MKEIASGELRAPKTVDRSTFQAELDALRVREKAHTREGDAMAAARRRLPMVEVNGAKPIVGERGAVSLLDAFECRRMLIAYYFMWHTGHPAPKQCEGCTWVTSQVRKLSYLHSRDVTFAVFCQGPYEESVRYRLHGLGDALVLGEGIAHHSPGRTPGRQDAHRLLPAAGIQCLRDLLDHKPRCRSDGQQLPVARPDRCRPSSRRATSSMGGRRRGRTRRPAGRNGSKMSRISASMAAPLRSGLA